MRRFISKYMKIILIVIIAAFGVSIFYGLGQYRTSERRQAYIAQVNNVGISYNQWQDTFQNVISRYDSKTLSNMKESEINSLKNNILQQMINSELLFQKAKKDKIKIFKDDINSEIDKIKEKFSSPEEFNNVLKANKITINQLKDDIKRQLMINKVLDNAKDKINITDDELLEYYNKNKEMFFEPEKVHAQHILVNTKEEAEEILLQLKEGVIDFSELAKEKSVGPSAKNGGDLGFFARGQMVKELKEFEDAAFSLKPSEISNILKTTFGYHIIKCIEKKEAHQNTFKEAEEKISNILRYQKEVEVTKTLLSNLKADANITINYDFKSENTESSSSSEENQSDKPSEGTASQETINNNNSNNDDSSVK